MAAVRLDGIDLPKGVETGTTTLEVSGRNPQRARTWLGGSNTLPLASSRVNHRTVTPCDKTLPDLIPKRTTLHGTFMQCSVVCFILVLPKYGQPHIATWPDNPGWTRGLRHTPRHRNNFAPYIPCSPSALSWPAPAYVRELSYAQQGEHMGSVTLTCFAVIWVRDLQ